MPLKDKWVDKINDVDYIDANDINEIAHSVIDIEEKSVENVLYTAQTLTAGQKSQARENIGAISKAAFYVTLTNTMGGYTSDATYAQIKSAYDSGYSIHCKVIDADDFSAPHNFCLPLTKLGSNSFIFEGVFNTPTNGVRGIRVTVDASRNNVEFYYIYNPETTTGDSVLYTPQTLTDEQKAQARENIGIPTTDEIVQAVIEALPKYNGEVETA